MFVQLCVCVFVVQVYLRPAQEQDPDRGHAPAAAPEGSRPDSGSQRGEGEIL